MVGTVQEMEIAGMYRYPSPGQVQYQARQTIGPVVAKEKRSPNKPCPYPPSIVPYDAPWLVGE